MKAGRSTSALNIRKVRYILIHTLRCGTHLLYCTCYAAATNKGTAEVLYLAVLHCTVLCSVLRTVPCTVLQTGDDWPKGGALRCSSAGCGGPFGHCRDTRELCANNNTYYLTVRVPRHDQQREVGADKYDSQMLPRIHNRN